LGAIATEVLAVEKEAVAERAAGAGREGEAMVALEVVNIVVRVERVTSK
jgi:hypothetical protein